MIYGDMIYLVRHGQTEFNREDRALEGLTCAEVDARYPKFAGVLSLPGPSRMDTYGDLTPRPRLACGQRLPDCPSSSVSLDCRLGHC
jgi:hypothetical protein